jgi:quinol monooxygenase YgiN
MVTLIVRYEPQPGTGDAIAAALAKQVAASRKEPGCVQFLAYRSLEDHDHFILYEQYADHDALAAHRETPHYLEMQRIVAPMLADRQRGLYREVMPEGA